MGKKLTYLLRCRTEEEIKEWSQFKNRCGSNSIKGKIFDLIKEYNKK